MSFEGAWRFESGSCCGAEQMHEQNAEGDEQ